MTTSTQDSRQDNQIPRLLGWRGAVAIISAAAVTLCIAKLSLSTATIMVSICAVPLLVLAVERGTALLGVRLDEEARAEAPAVTASRPAPPAAPGGASALQRGPLRSRRIASRVKLESH